VRDFKKLKELKLTKKISASNKFLAEKKILVLEGGPGFKKKPREQFSNRVSAINSQSVSLLKSLDNAWEFIESTRCKPVKKMEVWGITGENIHFNHPEFMGNVAYIVENDLILESLYDRVDRLKNIEIVNGTGVENCEFVKPQEIEVNTVKTKHGEEFSCDLLVGADGYNSTVRKLMNVNTLTVPYHQMGVVATLKLDNDGSDNDVAYQRFIPGGPIAILPLSSSESSLVWTTSKDHAKELIEMPSEVFVEHLNDALTKQFEVNPLVKGIVELNKVLLSRKIPKAPKITEVYEKSRAAFPLGLGHASSYVANGCLLIGDAAHRVHPLAGQGVNLGFGDVAKLTKILGEALYSGSEINNLQYLLKYEKECLKANVPIMLGVHAIQRLYCSEFPVNVLLRHFGLTAANFPPLKKFFMDKAYA
jgi:ubiquinone biosynthesis monooxygenase Coq6